MKTIDKNDHPTRASMTCAPGPETRSYVAPSLVRYGRVIDLVRQLPSSPPDPPGKQHPGRRKHY